MSVTPTPQWISATVPKQGNRPEENEDAVRASPDGLRFAVADGATEGWESGPWATHLATCYVAGPPEPADFDRWLASARDWAPPPLEGPQPWYVAEKQEQGSFATLVGIELRHSRRTDGWSWRSLAVGDSCLLHVRGSELTLTFPLESAKEFGSRPALIPSAVGACPKPQWCAGRADPGDLLLLATDAAALRLFDPAARAEAVLAVAAALARLNPQPLADWCQSVQGTTNDDVSILAIQLSLTPM
jgi:hypothetical protein